VEDNVQSAATVQISDGARSRRNKGICVYTELST